MDELKKLLQDNGIEIMSSIYAYQLDETQELYTCDWMYTHYKHKTLYINSSGMTQRELFNVLLMICKKNNARVCYIHQNGIHFQIFFS